MRGDPDRGLQERIASALLKLNYRKPEEFKPTEEAAIAAVLLK